MKYKVYFYRAETPKGIVIGNINGINPKTILSELMYTLKNRHNGECDILSLSLLGEVNE